MSNKDLFFKNLETYLDIKLSEFDRKRIGGYMDEYVGGLPEKKAHEITKIKTVYKYLSDIEEKINDSDIVLVAPSEIISLITHKTGIGIRKLMGRHRYSETVLARHVAMYFINQKCHETLVKTGAIFNRDHTSVINAIRNVRNMIEGGNEKYIGLVTYISETISQQKQTA